MRIAIVNDTKMALEGLKRIIAAAPEHEISWLAHVNRIRLILF